MVGIPTRLGRYEVQRVLGTGAFGTVYLAEDPALDDLVAIKTLAENWSFDPEFRSRFIQEARVMRRVVSDHLVRVHDIGETNDGQPFFVMDFAEGGTLEDRLERRTAGDNPARLTLDDTMVVARAIAAGLADLHREGIVHRDLKPSNLVIRSNRRGSSPVQAAALLEPGERLLLSDFGLAKDLSHGSGLTIAGGTPGYMAPEQRIPGARIDQRADVYAASALVARLLSGRPPLIDGSWDRSGQHSLVVAVVARGLALLPEERHPDIAIWVSELERATATTEPVLVGPGTIVIGPADSRETIVVGPADSRETVIVGPTEPTQPSWWSRLPMRRRSVGVGAAAAVLAGAVVVANGGAGGSDDGLRVAIDGASRIEIGEPQEYRADLQGAVSHYWIDWNNDLVERDSLIVEPISPGQLTFTLVATDTVGLTSRVDRTVVVEQPELRVAIKGPAEITLGRSATYTADVRGAVSYSWTDWDGQQIEGATFVVDPVTTGQLTFTLKAADSFGNTESAKKTVIIVDG